MTILGLHRDPWHDTGAAIIRDDGDGPRIVMVSEERLDRFKDSRAFPRRAIEACMADAGVGPIDEIDLVVLDYIRVPDWGCDEHLTPAARGTSLEQVAPGRIHIVNHHLAHACSAFYSSTYDDAAILVVDMAADPTTRRKACSTASEHGLSASRIPTASGSACSTPR